VIEFAELEEFKDLKPKNYSSGMNIRLAFSVAIQVDADILLIDEVLAVGDASFQQKCFDVFNDLRDRGKTIVFVTHDMSSMQRFCHRALLLEEGVPIYLGDPSEVADRYLEINFGRTETASVTDGDDGDRLGSGDARVMEVWVADEAGNRLDRVPQHHRVVLAARVRFNVDVEDPACSIYVHNDEHKAVLVLSTTYENEHTGHFRAGEEAVFSFGFDNILAPGRFNPVVWLSHRGEGLDVMDRYEGSFSFVVTGPLALGGLVDVPLTAEVTRVEPADDLS
jgi:ABC-type Fe3+/spermidine/putrescine transport system ATPase subunit